MRWNEFTGRYSEKFGREVTDRITSGHIKLENGNSFHVMVHGYPAGLVFSRRFRPLNSKAWLDWNSVERVSVLPSILPASAPAKVKRHTDAVLMLCEGMPDSKIDIPWMDDFESLLPSSVLVTHRQSR